MSSNKNRSIRERLEDRYGKGCMFRNAGIAERIESRGGIKTYKQYIEERKYKIKKIIQLEKQMTLHHLKHRSEGGATSEQNGAVISVLAHRYLHSLPREDEEVINGILRDYKYKECKIEYVDELDLGIKVKYTEISFSEPKREKKFNRAKEKEEFRRRVEEELEY